MGTALTGCAVPVIRTPKEEVAQFPLIDNHSHFLSKQQRSDIGTTPDELLKAMDAAGIRRMIVVGFGPEVPELPKRYPGRFVASYIYNNFRSRQDIRLVGRIPERQRIVDGTSPREVEWIGGEFEEALKTGLYRALGEITTIANPIPASALGGTTIPASGANVSPDSPLVRRLIELAGKYDVPINIHCEDYALQQMVHAVGAYPKTRVIWAHTGSYLSPSIIRGLLRDYPNLDFDLSAKNLLYRSPRSAQYSLLSSGVIDESWRQLFEAHPDRFYFGVDFLTAEHLRLAAQIGQYVQAILAQLTPPTARKIAYENAVRTYGLA